MPREPRPIDPVRIPDTRPRYRTAIFDNFQEFSAALEENYKDGYELHSWDASGRVAAVFVRFSMWERFRA